MDDAELGTVDNNESSTDKKANQSGEGNEKVIWSTTGKKLSNSTGGKENHPRRHRSHAPALEIENLSTGIRW